MRKDEGENEFRVRGGQEPGWAVRAGAVRAGAVRGRGGEGGPACTHTGRKI